MNSIDILSIGILVLLTGLGIWTGLVRALFRLAALAAGIAGAWLLGGTTASWLLANIVGFPPMLSAPAGRSATFLACWITVTLIGFVIGKLVRKSPLGTFDRLGGGILGMAKGLVLCLALAALLAAIPAKGNLASIRESSTTYHAYLWGVGLVFP